MNFRRFSFVSDYSDNEIDQSFKNLYPSSEAIDQRCSESINDRKSLILSTPYRSAVQPVTLEKSFQQVIDHLPNDYYDPQYDPVTDHLNEISSWKEVDTVEKFMSKIEETDTDKDVIIGELTSMIDANYDELMTCMRKIQEVSYELKSANGTVCNAREYLNRSALLIKNGALRVKLLDSRKRKLMSLLETLNNLKLLKSIHQEFTSSLAFDDFSASSKLAVLVCKHLQSGQHNRFSALGTIKSSVVQNLRELRSRIDDRLNYLVCRKLDTVEYSNAMSSFIVLDFIYEQYREVFLEVTSPAGWTSPLDSLAKFLCHFHILDIENCLRTAATESLFYGQNRKGRRSSEIGRISIGGYDEHQAIAPELPLNVILRKVPVECLPGCIIRSCDLIHDVLHTYDSIVNWHIHPFQVLADERITEESLNDIGSMQSKIEVGISTRLKSLDLHDLSILETAAAELTEKYFSVLLDLNQCKPILWDEITRRLIELIKLASFSNDVKLEDFVTMMSALQNFCDFGESFSSSKNSFLRGFIENKATDFFVHYHADSFQMLRAKLEAELWQSIPIGDTEEDNSLQSVLKSLAKDASKMDDQTASLSDDFSDSTGNTPTRSVRSPMVRKNSKLFSNLYSSDSGNDRESNPALKKSKRVISIVVTQSSLHGVAKQVFKYLDILTSMPVNASEVIDCMCQLFDFYICEVFSGFVSQDDQARFLGTPTKMNSTPPDQEKEFQVIKMFVEKALGESVLMKSHYDDDVDSIEASENNHQTEIEGGNRLEPVKFQSLLSVPGCVQSASVNSFFALKERMVAAESCHFVAQVLREIKPRIVPLVSAEVASKLDQVVDNYVYAAEQLRSLIYKLMCPALINQNSQVLNSIVETQWDSRKPPERQHDWVDKLVLNCKKVWEFMSLSDFPEMIQEQIWLEICQAVFDVTLEGFSRVRKCTAEGRAAMTLDLFALHEGLNKTHLCRPPRGKPYVDSYLRTFYLSEEEVMAWVQQNWQAYAYRHMHGLLQQTMSSMLNSKKLRDALQVIDNLYDVENNGNSISTIFSTRLKEDSFSSLIGSKFRR